MAADGTILRLDSFVRYVPVELLTDWKDAGSEKNSETLLAASEGAVRIALDDQRFNNY